MKVLGDAGCSSAFGDKRIDDKIDDTSQVDDRSVTNDWRFDDDGDERLDALEIVGIPISSVVTILFN